ncbi:glycosyltransferase family 2 protein [Botryobasidium botryosum FD-172 SS1]|uniref:chitin synthase n=1 Tax=Botryobasidium botryosum (strain FD-172 SS1) TaxID=930990 RepID=A0A067N0V6_BOTB1|nr:glycosyltransferase family 2 protein [Botryobasidium botryosum FD-172 SS1]
MAHPNYTTESFDSSSVPQPTSRPPPNRGASLRRGKTLTRPERGVAPAPLINPPATLLPIPGAAIAPLAPDAHRWEAWSIFAHIVTFWAPPVALASLAGMKDQPTRQAWREKIALCFIALLLGAFVGFATMGLQKVLCPENAINDLDLFSSLGAVPGTLGIQGIQFNVSASRTTPQVDFYQLAAALPGQDITTLFSRQLSDFPRCVGQSFMAATDPPCPASTPCPLGPLNSQTFQTLNIVQSKQVVGYDWDQVAIFANYLVIDGSVLNLGPYMTLHPNANTTDPVDTALRTVLRLQSPVSGKDATRLFYSDNTLQAAVPCLVQRYYAGHIDKITPGCFISRLFLYVSLIVILSVVLARFAMACVFNWFMSARLVTPPKDPRQSVLSPSVLPEGANIAIDSKNGTAPWTFRKSLRLKPQSSRPSSPSPMSRQQTNGPLMDWATIGPELYAVCLVTCYSEGEEGIRITCDSIAGTNYADDRKLLFIVADGMVTGEGEKRSTPDICVGLIEADPRFGNPMPMTYGAVGSGAKAENRAMVYAGHYVCKGHRTPTVVVVKCGTEAEAAKDKKPGNRGKRDSQLILMNFFSRVTYNDRMTPLDFDLFRKLHVLMGVTPDFFEVCLMVDADTKVYPDSMKHLVNCMQNDNYIMGVCGETRIANKRQSWVSMIQVYEYFISHHLAKAFESVFGGVTCLPGCFSMYRLKARKATDNDWVPIITKPEIVREYSQSVVTTLHQKNLLLLGEDRFLTTILLRTFPNRKMMFCPQALCRTVVPDTFAMLLSQRRRWINSTIHNLMELVRVRNLCGTFCFSMQFVVFMDLLGTTVLPVAICLTYALVVGMAMNPPKSFDTAIPLMLLLTVLGLPAILILITTRKVVYVFWMMIYLIALPVWNFMLPVYAFWHFDDFSWGETRRVEGEGASKAHDDAHDVEHKGVEIPLRRWEDWERSRLRKLKRDEKRRQELERLNPEAFSGYDTQNSLTPNGSSNGINGNGTSGGGQNKYLRPRSADGRSEMSTASSDEDQWGPQIGGYNEATSARYAPPPVATPLEAPVYANGRTLDRGELEAMLDQGFQESRTPSPAGNSGNSGNAGGGSSGAGSARHLQPSTAARYQLSDDYGNGRYDAYSAVPRSPSSPVSPLIQSNGVSSAVGGEWKTHVKKRSAGGGRLGMGERQANEEYGPLGPLDPNPPTGASQNRY